MFGKFHVFSVTFGMSTVWHDVLHLKKKKFLYFAYSFIINIRTVFDHLTNDYMEYLYLFLIHLSLRKTI